MPKVAGTITIDAPPEEVFDLMTDPERAPEWSSTVESASLNGPVEVGGTFDVEASFLGKSLHQTYEITEHDRPSRYVYRADKPMKVTMSADFAQAGDGTEVTLEVDLDPGMVFAAAGPLLKRQMRKQVEKDLENLKAAAEG